MTPQPLRIGVAGLDCAPLALTIADGVIGAFSELPCTIDSVNAGITQLKRLIKVLNAQPLGTGIEYRLSHWYQAVAVGIGLDHGHQSGLTAENFSKLVEVPLDRLGVNFDPSPLVAVRQLSPPPHCRHGSKFLKCSPRAT